jgi:hypothetical protein
MWNPENIAGVGGYVQGFAECLPFSSNHQQQVFILFLIEDCIDFDLEPICASEGF